MMRLAVSWVLCRQCRALLTASVPRTYTEEVWAATDPGDREIDQVASGCSPAFASWAECPDHPAPPPDLGFSYSPAALPLLWGVDVIESPVMLGAGDIVRCEDNSNEHRPHAWSDDEFPADFMLCIGERQELLS